VVLNLVQNHACFFRRLETLARSEFNRMIIDALNGAVIALAHQCQIAVPHNLALYNMVKFIEAKTR